MNIPDCFLKNLKQEVDGYYYFFPPEGSGCYSAIALRTIADELDELNKDWDMQIEKKLGPLLNNTQQDYGNL